MSKEGDVITKKSGNVKKALTKEKTSEQKKFEKLTNSLTKELFEIAIGQAMDGDGGKATSASLSERLKAAELLARYRKNNGESEGIMAQAVIIDDIK